MTQDTATPCVAERSFRIPVCGLLKWDDTARFWRAIRGLYRAPEIRYNRFIVPDESNALTVSDSQGGELAPSNGWPGRPALSSRPPRPRTPGAPTAPTGACLRPGASARGLGRHPGQCHPRSEEHTSEL